MAATRHKDHSKILLSNNKIYKKTDFSRNTFIKYIGKLKELGLVQLEEDGYYCVNEDIFPVEKESLPKKLAEEMNQWYNTPVKEHEHLKKMYSYYSKDNFKNLHMDPVTFCNNLLAGYDMKQMKEGFEKEAKRRGQSKQIFPF